MKLGYFFMTCAAYHEEKTRPLYNTVVQRVIADEDHAFFLSGVQTFDDIPLIKVSGGDGYGSCTPKLFSVFKNQLPLEYDWFLFADDDTFIDTTRLRELCATLSTTDLQIHGKKINNRFIYGGSGILMNRATFLAIQSYCEANHYPQHWHSDIALSRCLDMMLIGDEPVNVECIDNTLFVSEESDVSQEIADDNWITMHMKDLDPEVYNYSSLEALVVAR